MKEELIFHLVNETQWKDAQQKGLYQPPEYEEEGYISCASGENVESVANEKFKDVEDLMLIVIDPTRVNALTTHKWTS